jgi:hypothetical protein
MASERVGLEEQSDLEQQQDPRGDLLKARPGGVTEPGGLVPPYDKDTAAGGDS